MESPTVSCGSGISNGLARKSPFVSLHGERSPSPLFLVTWCGRVPESALFTKLPAYAWWERYQAMVGAVQFTTGSECQECYSEGHIAQDPPPSQWPSTFTPAQQAPKNTRPVSFSCSATTHTSAVLRYKTGNLPNTVWDVSAFLSGCPATSGATKWPSTPIRILRWQSN